MSLWERRLGLGTAGSWFLTWCLACHKCSVVSKSRIFPAQSKTDYFLTLFLSLLSPSLLVLVCLSVCLSICLTVVCLFLSHWRQSRSIARLALNSWQSSCLSAGIYKAGMVAYAYKHSTLETEAGGFLHVQAIFSYIVSGLSEIHSQILSQKFQN